MAPTDLPPPPAGDPLQPSPPRTTRADDQDSDDNRRMHVAGLMVGTALMFLGFLQVFLSISGGFEIDVIPFLIYFGGVAVWANAAIENPTLRYSIIGGVLFLGAVLKYYDEVLFWHKQVLFWTTVVIVMYFMFNEPKKSA